MGTPSKRRKLNESSKSSPASSSRSLDFFFGKQTQKTSAGPQKEEKELSPSKDGHKETELTDEQLARKLQAEWDLEAEIRPNNVGSVPELEVASKGRSSLGKSTTISGPKEENGGAAIGSSMKDGEMIKSPESGYEAEPQPETNANFVPILSELKGPKTLSLQSAGSAEDTITSTIPFDESPLIFDPSKYVTKLQGHWEAEGGNASYALLTRCFVLVNSTQSRIKIVDTLVNLLRVIIEGDPSSLLPTVRINITLLYKSG